MNDLAIAAIANTQAAAGEPSGLQAGYGISLTDLSSFNASLNAAAGRVEAGQNISAPSEAARVMFKPLEYINEEAKQISQYAEVAAAAGADMTPGEMVMLTVRSHEFMFHCQLTSNIANRTSDGLQQLFRQQS